MHFNKYSTRKQTTKQTKTQKCSGELLGIRRLGVLQQSAVMSPKGEGSEDAFKVKRNKFLLKTNNRKFMLRNLDVTFYGLPYS